MRVCKKRNEKGCNAILRPQLQFFKMAPEVFFLPRKHLCSIYLKSETRSRSRIKLSTLSPAIKWSAPLVTIISELLSLPTSAWSVILKQPNMFSSASCEQPFASTYRWENDKKLNVVVILTTS